MNQSITFLRRTAAFFVLLVFVSTNVAYAEKTTGEVEEARQVLVDFMAAFNARDTATWADTLHFPHVRIASGNVTVHQTSDEFIAAMDFDKFIKTTGWHHSAWDSIEVAQANVDKVHFRVAFTRYDANNNVIASYQSFYVVEVRNGRWGIVARSSFAP